MAVAPDVGRDLDDVARRALRREAAAVDHRPRVLDPDPWRRLARRGRGHSCRRCHFPRCRNASRLKIERSSGVQLHPTSLPSGRLGRTPTRFVDWLAAAGQSWWQTLPLGPPDRHGSPYKASSAFAAWPGLLAEPDAPVGARRSGRSASARRPGSTTGRPSPARARSPTRCASSASGAPCAPTPPSAACGSSATSRSTSRPGSADHVAHPELFLDGIVSGAPPDAYTELGQLWGNPLYDWPAMQRRGYRWWVERFRRTFDQVDLARIDHFRGFVAYWAVPADAADARAGSWRRGPGRAPFEAARAVLGARCPFIAEDLGVITPAGRAPARRPRPARDGRAPVRLRPGGPAQPAQARPPRGRARRLHRHARPRHRARLVRERVGRRARERSTPTSTRTGCARTRCRGRSSASPSPRARGWPWCSCRTCSGWAARGG